MTDKTLLVEESDGVVTVTLNRPEVHNAFNDALIAEAIEAGGSSLRDFAAPGGELGYFSKRFSVYDRESKPCACGGVVKRIVQGGRSTFYCSQCQR